MAGFAVLIFSGPFLALAGSGDPSAEPKAVFPVPPKPDFEKRVDFFGWYQNLYFEPDWPHGEDVYRKITQAYDNDRFHFLDDSIKQQLNAGHRGPWSAEEMPELAAYVRELEPFVEEYRRIARVPNVQWLGNLEAGKWMSYKVPSSIYPLRILNKVILARAWMDAETITHRAEQLVDAWRVNLAHVRLSKSQSLIPILIAIANRAINYESMRRAMELEWLQGDDLKRLERILEEDDSLTALRRAVLIDWCGLLDFVQAIHPNGRWSDAAVAAAGQDKILPKGGALFNPSARKTASKLTEWFQPSLSFLNEPWSASVYRKMEAHEDRRAKIAKSNLILSTYLASYSRPYQLALRTEAERRATLLLIAVYLHKHETGEWPESIDELKAGELDSIRFDPVGEHDFVLGLRDGQPLLYSVGFDGQDNGGEHDSRWAEKEPGGDFVFFPLPE